MPLTDLQIRQLPPHAARREVWDERLPGFGIRISSSGHKSFVLLYRHNGRCRRMTMGRYPVVGLAAARAKAFEALALLARGVDPQARKDTDGAARFDATVDQFVATYCTQNNRESTRRETHRLLKTRFVSRWGSRPLREITKTDVLTIVDEVVAAGAPSAANHALATVRVFFNWCADRGLIDVNPCDRLKFPAKKNSRDRVLSDIELARIWPASGSVGYPFGALTQLLLLTAQRRNEVVQMRWSHLNFEDATWTIPGALTKNGSPHLVPLVPEVVAILRAIPRLTDGLLFPSAKGDDVAFSGFSNAKARLDQHAGVEPFTLHDLRRTAATHMARLAVAPHVIEKVLNHVTGITGGVAGVYNRFNYRSEVRDALGLWTAHLQNVVGWAVFDRAIKCAVRTDRADTVTGIKASRQ